MIEDEIKDDSIVNGVIVNFPPFLAFLCEIMNDNLLIFHLRKSCGEKGVIVEWKLWSLQQNLP